MVLINKLFFSPEYAYDRANILRCRNPGLRAEGGTDVLHGVRLVPALGGGQAPSHRHRVLVQVILKLIY